MKTFFLKRGSVVKGPLDVATIKRLASQGKIKPTDMIGPSEAGPWKEAEEIKGLTDSTEQKAYSIAESADAPSDPPPQPFKSPATTEPEVIETVEPAMKRLDRKSWAVTAGIAAVTMFVGYFAGREHVKYEIRSTLTAAGKAFSAKMQGEDIRPAAAPAVAPKATNRVEIGGTFTGDGLNLTLASAKVDKVPITDTLGKSSESADQYLILTFAVRNTDERKILSFSGGSSSFRNYFRARDDVDNQIRGITFGFSNDPAGALSSSDDISPGETASHVEVFSIPLPKTKELFLVVDLKVFGKEGDVEFRIPADQIEGFERG